MQKISLLLIAGLLNFCSRAELRLPAIIGDNMILQRDKPATIWGWADAGQTVSISFMKKIYRSKANANGEWKVLLAPVKGGMGGDMIITAGQEKKTIKQIVAGEVWLCSGQSNMEYILGGFKEFYKEEIRTAKDPNLRYITVKNDFSNKEAINVALKNSWIAIDSASVKNCSAVAYFFAKQLRKKLNVPVGLVISSWGGTPAQSWMDTASLKAFPCYSDVYNSMIKPIDFSKLAELKKQNEDAYRKKVAGASGIFNELKGPGYDDTNWEKTTLPKSWELLGHPDLDGIAAYRISFTLPEAAENKPASLHLPAIDDIDSTFINGVFVGTHRVWNELRVYDVPANILKAGKNVISIRVEDGGGGGGLNEDPDNYYLQLSDQRIALRGEAKFKILASMENIAGGINYASMQNQPAVLFNAMIAPLLPLTFSGVIWYQGESNDSKYIEYRTLFPALIKGWRKRFEQNELSFLFVQLSSYNPSGNEPEESHWAGLREAQSFALKLPKTGMAVTIDVGDAKDIHPKRKKEVGERLAANAFNIVYGFKNEVAAGPLMRSSLPGNNNITVTFSNVGKGLEKHGEKLKGFSIAGADKKFVQADAVISGDAVIVSNTLVAAPMFVRYAWANAPVDANLYNKEGLPAAPFRTDKD